MITCNLFFPIILSQRQEIWIMKDLFLYTDDYNINQIKYLKGTDNIIIALSDVLFNNITIIYKYKVGF